MIIRYINRLANAVLRSNLHVPHFPRFENYMERQRTRDLLKQLRINCFLDVGANKGWYAKELRKLGFEGYIVSFEPIEEDCQQIEKLARGDSRWSVHNIALGSMDGSKKFHVLEGTGTTLSSFLEPTISLPKTTRLVEIRRLDTVLQTLLDKIFEPRIFLKMDTQGYDVEVMKGIGAYISKIHGLLSEVSVIPLYEEMPHYTVALAFYESLGFSLMDLFPVNRTELGCIVEYNCMMARINVAEKQEY